MTRMLAFALALLMSAITVTGTCVAAKPDPIRFTLASTAGPGRVQLHLRSGERGSHSMSSDFAASELSGLDLTSLRAGGRHPVRFALLRDAGRIDCAGEGRSGHADGGCSFAADPRFADRLAAAGIGRPTREQAYGLAMLGTKRDLVDAIASAHFPRTSVDDLMGLTALGVDARYIRDLSARGYRPDRTSDLIQFKALDVTPAYLDGMRRVSGRRFSAEEIGQLKALDVSPEYVAGFARAGYPNLSAETLVQFKAVGVTPEFARSLRARGFASLTPGEIVQLQVTGLAPRRRR